MSALFDIIRRPFGWLIQWFHSFTGSYLFAILLFSIVLKLVLFPFGIKQQKNSQKQAALRPKENIIRKKYAGRNDRATQLKMNTEIQELYQKENFNPLGGCLPMLLQMLVLFAVYAVVRMPLTYTAGLSKESVNEVQQIVAEMVYEEGEKNNFAFSEIKSILKVELTAPSKDASKKDIAKIQKENDKALNKALKDNAYQYNSEILVINYINENKDAFEKAFDSRFEKGEKEKGALTSKDVFETLPNLEVFSGFDLGTTPGFGLLQEKELGKKLILLVPIFSLITAYVGQWLTRKFTYQPEQTEEMKSQMRTMNIFMPLFSLYISTQVPAAVGIYWIMSNILSPVQQFALSKMFPIKEITPEEMREAERLYGGKQKKKKSNTATPGKKKKSLVYDDDDTYESISKVPEKTVLKEKKESGEKNLVEKAPLKKDKKD